MNSQVQKHVCRRFGTLVKYTFTNGQYWDVDLQRFVPLRSYYYIIWCSLYYAGHCFQIMIALYLTQLGFNDLDIPEIYYDHKNLIMSQRHDKFVIGLGIVIWHIIVSALCVASLTIEFQIELTETLNQAFVLDSSFKRLFPSTRFRSSNKLEKIIPGTCWLPLLIPPIFNLAFFHPSNPFRALIQNVLEIEIALLSPFCWGFLLLQTWAVACVVGVALGAILPLLIVVIVCQNWLLDASLELSTARLRQYGPFETKQLGNVSEDQIILIYRALQLLSGLSNLVCATTRFAYHSAGMLMIVVFSSFTLIKQGRSLLSGGSIMAFSLATILIVSVILCLLIFYVECQVIDELEARSQRYKNNIITSKSRRSRVYKTAISFRTVTVKTTYPFCNVNKSTFLEWTNVAINNLVTLLLI